VRHVQISATIYGLSAIHLLLHHKNVKISVQQSLRSSDKDTWKTNLNHGKDKQTSDIKQPKCRLLFLKNTKMNGTKLNK